MTLDKLSRAEKTGFRLELGRTTWHLIGAEGTEDWLARFARVLELKPWKGEQAGRQEGRRLFFLRATTWPRIRMMIFNPSPRRPVFPQRDGHHRP